MSKAWTYGRNAGLSWAGLVANMVVAFLISPFIVHSLGNRTYGIWSILWVIGGYMGLIEVGVRASTGRFLNYHVARGEQRRVDAVFNTAVAFYCVAGPILLVLVAVAAALFPWVSGNVREGLTGEVAVSLVLMATGVWAALIGSTFAQLLIVKERFGVKLFADMTVLALRTGGIWTVLSHGGGLVGLAAVTSGSQIAAALLLACLGKEYGQPVTLSPRLASRNALREMLGFGLPVFLGSASVRITAYIGTILVGLVLGMNEVTYYSIALMLAEYGRAMAASVGVVLVPDIQKMAGRRSLEELRWLVVRGVRLMIFGGIPLFVGMAILGGYLIRLWMGPGYESCNSVNSILAVSQLVSLPRYGCGEILLGLGFVRLESGLLVVGAALSVALGLLLSIPWGLQGIAWGVLLATVTTYVVWEPVCACRAIRMRPVAFLKSSMTTLFLGSTAFGALCLAAVALFRPVTWLRFVVMVGLLGLAYLPVGCYLVLDRQDRKSLWSAFCRLVPGGKGPGAATENAGGEGIDFPGDRSLDPSEAAVGTEEGLTGNSRQEM
jgi:O-antigen/teichoic acid export membrane protein